VRIGPDVWLGTKVTVLRGATVGRGSVVAAHCLVNDDVPPYSVAVGVPVRVVRNRLDDAKAREAQEAIWAAEAARNKAASAVAAGPAAAAGTSAPTEPAEQSDAPMTSTAETSTAETSTATPNAAGAVRR
jgi:tetrahydrodipicolinate N-succinyltransferase